MKKQVYNILRILILALCLLSCVDKEIGNISDTVFFTPNYSLPIGSIEVTMEEIVNEFGGTLDAIPDSLVNDSTLVFFYDKVNYTSPHIFEHTETKQFDFSEIASKLEYVKSLTFRINSVNDIPAGIKMQVYFMGGGGALVIDSLFNNGRLLIETAKIDSSGSLLSSGETWEHDTSFDSVQINKLQYVDQIKIHATLNIEEVKGKNIKYFSEQKFWLQIGLRVEFDLPLHEI